MLYAVSAYIFWGLHPVYWKLLKHVSSFEIVSHRVFWSLLFFILIMTARRDWQPFINIMKKNYKRPVVYIPAFLIGSNWALYIWAVNTDYVIETSLGYFICPLISVFLGVVFLRERLRKVQWLAVLIAGAGVVIMTVIYGQFPWISLFLATTWGLYGLLRKKSPLNSLQGLALETTLLSIPALFYLFSVRSFTGGAFQAGWPTPLLLIGTGLISGLPLLVFITGARMINLSLIGILQYIYPTLIFCLGAFVFHEPLSEAKLVGFAFIWTALIVYTIEGSLHLRAKKVELASAT